jgi:CBS domain containing-hemolysin-like protein
VSLYEGFTFRFGSNADDTNQLEEEIKTLAESGEETGQIESDERELIHSVFEFADTVAREIMTPRVDLDSMPVKSDPADVVRVIEETGHSRIPLYDETDDDILGVVHAKDLLGAMAQGRSVELRRLLRPVLTVPEGKYVRDLLAEMRAARTQMAIIQDEFGGTAGVVTIEDIVEELVGDIVDEYDEEESEVVDIEGGWLVDGKTHIDDLNDRIGSEFETNEFDTVGGFLFGHFGRQPKAGESIDLDRYRFTVTDTDGRRISQLRIERVAEPGFDQLDED